MVENLIEPIHELSLEFVLLGIRQMPFGEESISFRTKAFEVFFQFLKESATHLRAPR